MIASNESPHASKITSYFTKLTLAIGTLALATVLAYHNLTDGDMWAKLALGASVWLRGDFIRHDIFAFTPVLPKYIDHEWGAGLIFYVLLDWFGPPSLMLLKIFLELGTLLLPAAIARRNGCSWTSILLLLIPAGAATLPGYVPVIRSHAFTYFFFALTLFGLEEMRHGRRWPAFLLVPLMLIWANVHGGFVAGLGTISVYTGLYILLKWRGARSSSAETTESHVAMFPAMALGCWLVTLINPYGFDFWRYLVPALLHPRREITEWHPLPLFANDAFIGFRLFFVIVLAILILGWRLAKKTSWAGLFMLALAACLGWKSRRHAPFFGVAAVAFAAPFLENILAVLAAQLSRNKSPVAPDPDSLATGQKKAALAMLVLYSGIALSVAMKFLPDASLHPLSPVGYDPVREADILSLAKAEGNLAVPFGWGSYCSWRLFPRIKVSIDGRYETTYPEETFQMNQDFFNKRGTKWDRLVREFPVDYIILDLRDPLRPEDLRPHGYVQVWQSGKFSTLLAKNVKVSSLEKVARELPPTTIDPLDANIPKSWW